VSKDEGVRQASRTITASFPEPHPIELVDSVPGEPGRILLFPQEKRGGNLIGPAWDARSFFIFLKIFSSAA